MRAERAPEPEAGAGMATDLAFQRGGDVALGMASGDQDQRIGAPKGMKTFALVNAASASASRPARTAGSVARCAWLAMRSASALQRPRCAVQLS